MDIAQALKQVNEAIEAAGIPDDLRAIAFEKAFDALMADEKAPIGEAGAGDSGGGSSLGESGSPTFARIGSSLGVNTADAERLFDDHEGELQFIGDVERLGGSKSEMVLRLAVILSAARQAGGYDDGATVDRDVRSEVDRHGLYDSTNYSKHVKGMRSFANVNGTGKNATYKMKHEGKKKAKEIATALLAES